MRKRLATFFIVLSLLTALLMVGFLERASDHSFTTTPSRAGLPSASVPQEPCDELCGGSTNR